eukprot:m.445045 g.445045  ORF g.445045 m.445045 type:complete len:157 (+) comp56843_c0_seq5:97-567(+)
MAGLLVAAVREASLGKCIRLIQQHSPAIIDNIPTAWTALHEAVCYDHRKILALFLTFAPQINLEACDRSGKTVLLIALLHLQLRCYEMLAAAGANLFPETTDGGLMVLCATAAGDVQRVQQLLPALPQQKRPPTFALWATAVGLHSCATSSPLSLS